MKMADVEERGVVVVNGGEGGGEGGGGEEDKLLEGVPVVDFDMLCATVALQTQGKWRKLENVEDDYEEGAEFGGVLRMWEGEISDVFEDRRIAIESACCPCHRFGKNMSRAGFGSCIIQGLVYFFFILSALLNLIAFFVMKRYCFLYMAFGFAVSVGTYLGYFRTQIRKKFNIRGGDSYLDDCTYHLICPCCTLSQESRTLEMNNVQDGTWHGRGDTIYIGTHAFLDFHPPPPPSIIPSEPFTMTENVKDGADQV